MVKFTEMFYNKHAKINVQHLWAEFEVSLFFDCTLRRRNLTNAYINKPN